MDPLSRRLMSGGRWKFIFPVLLAICILFSSSFLPGVLSPARAAGGATTIFLPLVSNGATQSTSAAKINVPFIPDDKDSDGKYIYAKRMAVFWFGQITPADTYTDVRIGYFADRLTVHFNIADRLLWYNSQPSGAAITQSDAVSLYLMPSGAATALRFDVQLSQCSGDVSAYQKAYSSSSSGWKPAGTAFTSSCYWRSENGPNDGADDEGWWIQFDIPFSSLGRSTPAEGEIWRMAATVYDLDNQSTTIRGSTTWPEGADGSQPASWNVLSFGMPAYDPPAATNLRTTLVRQGENGVVVPDVSVGGYMVCGDGYDKWSEWGWVNEKQYSDTYRHDRVYANVQNQLDISDRPCFSRYYVDFPLNAIPAGKVIQSAKLSLYHYGNSDPDNAIWSYLQVLRVSPDWNEDEIVWNNAPLVNENFSGASVAPLTPANPAGVGGVEVSWDVTAAVVEAYNAHNSVLGLAVYSSDRGMNSGKYFFTSDYYLAAARPALEITWGDPAR